MRNLILGTAGHIDHGKTSLVQALTGVNTDRLPEEKARGITIDIGFAHLTLGDYRLGIVDVPGHERFIKNMLAGATGIDLVMLIVAADDGIMPQTREHFEILKLLGIQQGLVVITKIDLVDETTAGVVALEIADFVRGSFLENAPIVPVSAHTGQGLDELKKALIEQCQKVQIQNQEEWFRIPIDRSFIVQGHGTVVTGSVYSGQLKVGDEVEWLPKRELVRVRSLQHHDQPVEEVHRGQRAAINLAGVNHQEVERGQELATPRYLVPSRVVSVYLHALPSIKKPLKHRLTCRFHIGTQELLGSVSLLEGDVLEPGAWGYAQLFLDGEVTATWGQGFVLRDSSATWTLGGGKILQPVGQKLRRRHKEDLEAIKKLNDADPLIRMEALAWFAGLQGIELPDMVRGMGVSPLQGPKLAEILVQQGKLTSISQGNRTLLIASDRLEIIEGRILEILQKLHTEKPLLMAHDRQAVLAQLSYVKNEELLQKLLENLIQKKQIVVHGRGIARRDFKPKLSINQIKLKDQVVEAHLKAGFQPPEPSTFGPKASGNTALLMEIFEVACAEGLLVKISDTIYLHAEHVAEMQSRLTQKMAEQPALTVAEIRDLLGTTRKYAVPICEYLDRVGITRREGDYRYLAKPIPPSAV